MLPAELWEHSCKSSSLPVDRKYQKGKSRDIYIISLFNSKYKLRWINAIFPQNKHNINALSENTTCIWIWSKSGEMIGEPRLYPVFKPPTHNLDMLKHCTKCVYFSHYFLGNVIYLYTDRYNTILINDSVQ